MIDAFDWVSRHLGTIQSASDVELAMQSPMVITDNGTGRVFCHFEEKGVGVVMQGNQLSWGLFFLKPNSMFASYHGEVIASLKANDDPQQVTEKLQLEPYLVRSRGRGGGKRHYYKVNSRVLTCSFDVIDRLETVIFGVDEDHGEASD